MKQESQLRPTSQESTTSNRAGFPNETAAADWHIEHAQKRARERCARRREGLHDISHSCLPKRRILFEMVQ